MSDLIFFNVDDGYAEAILRGLRKSFLGEITYANIRNASSLKDLKSVNINIKIQDFIRYRLHRLGY